MGLKRRLTRLEGGRGRGRCSCGVVAIYVAGQFHRASQRGVPITEEALRSYAAANVDGICHVCGGEISPPITVGGPAHAARGRGREGAP
jgi:hypothetical protein